MFGFKTSGLCNKETRGLLKVNNFSLQLINNILIIAFHFAKSYAELHIFLAPHSFFEKKRRGVLRYTYATPRFD